MFLDNAILVEGNVEQHVSLSYGSNDSTVPVFIVEFLEGALGKCTLFLREAGHGLCFKEKNGDGFIGEDVLVFRIEGGGRRGWRSEEDLDIWE